VPQNPHSRNFAGFSSPQFGQATVSTHGVYGRRGRRHARPRRMHRQAHGEVA
jgi:hypothetical protein